MDAKKKAMHHALAHEHFTHAQGHGVSTKEEHEANRALSSIGTPRDPEARKHAEHIVEKRSEKIWGKELGKHKGPIPSSLEDRMAIIAKHTPAIKARHNALGHFHARKAGLDSHARHLKRIG